MGETGKCGLKKTCAWINWKHQTSSLEFPKTSQRGHYISKVAHKRSGGQWTHALSCFLVTPGSTVASKSSAFTASTLFICPRSTLMDSSTEHTPPSSPVPVLHSESQPIWVGVQTEEKNLIQKGCSYTQRERQKFALGHKPALSS